MAVAKEAGDGMIVASRDRVNLGADFPQAVVDNAQLLKSEVARLDTDIQACRASLPAEWVSGWEIWRDTANALAESTQNNQWYDIAAGGLWIAVKRAFGGDGIRDMIDSVITWRNQAKAKGCTVNGPDPTKPAMPFTTQLMWAVGGLLVLGVAGTVAYGFATKQGPTQIYNRIVRK